MTESDARRPEGVGLNRNTAELLTSPVIEAPYPLQPPLPGGLEKEAAMEFQFDDSKGCCAVCMKEIGDEPSEQRFLEFEKGSAAEDEALGLPPLEGVWEMVHSRCQ